MVFGVNSGNLVRKSFLRERNCESRGSAVRAEAEHAALRDAAEFCLTRALSHVVAHGDPAPGDGDGLWPE